MTRDTPTGADELLLASRDLGDGLRQTDLAVPGMHCAACMAAIEKNLAAVVGVVSARVNLSTKRVCIKWKPTETRTPDFGAVLADIGYEAHAFSSEPDRTDPHLSRLIRATAVAGFAAANIMMLSVSVWAGADAATRQVFHIVSAALAAPAIAYAGSVFFISAWSALRRGATNMDVPISIGVLLAFGLSLYDTLYGAEHAYFDAAVTLLFFLLVGRTLDHIMREKARSAVAGLARLSPRGAMKLDVDGTRTYVPLGELARGDTIHVAVGDRIPVDGVVVGGTSELDASLVTGETLPRPAATGAWLEAGLMNLTGPLTIQTTATAETSFLSEIVRMMEAAEGGRARYRRIADRASALYAPMVHLIAAMTCLYWLAVSGDWHASITIAIAVLIITCPCALGLAVPIVQVVAARRLFDRRIMVRDGSALERLAEIDTVAFDKTGTLTLGNPRLANAGDADQSSLALAAAMAGTSRHPLAKALTASGSGLALPQIGKVSELPGRGIEAQSGPATYRLGRPEWALADAALQPSMDETMLSVLSRNGEWMATFRFEDVARPDARRVMEGISALGLNVEILSGDRTGPVAALASALGIDRASAELLPAGKIDRLARLAAGGKKVLMVGDGLNDAPALAAAHASMAPVTAADVGRNAADFVFLNDSLGAVLDALETARRARTLIRQNFAIAIGYNALAVPLAVSGHVTPLFAAVAMSLSSIMVVANAMRLGGPRIRRSREPAQGSTPSIAPGRFRIAGMDQ